MRNPAVSRIVRCLLLLGLLAAALLAQAPPARAPLPAPTNLDFEQGQPGEVPPGWSISAVSRENGYTAKIVTDRPASGKQAVEVALAGEKKDPRAFGNFVSSFDATPFRGQRVRFRAAVRAEVAGRDWAGLWLRVDREGGARGFFDNMSDRPITSAEWKTYEIVGDVAADAKILYIGLLLEGSGKAWIDSASFVALGTVVTRHEPARPLAGRGLDNLIAFTRLFGDLRYFHPSDQAAAADWEALALAGVQAAEPAASPEELARVLEGFFGPLAPTLRVYPTAGPRPALPAELKPPAGNAGLEVTSWEHHGVKLSNRPNIYRSDRVTHAAAAPGGTSPRLEEPAAVDLGGGVSALIPLALYRDGGGTLPHAPPVSPPAAGRTDAPVPSGDDRATRLADVVLAWNVFQHFYPYFDVVEADWPGELRRALAAAATDAGERAFLTTLQRLVAALHDGHGNVYLSSQAATAELPVLFDWVEDQLVISQVAAAGAGGLRPGDVVVALDGRPAREVLADTESLVSGATEQWRRWVALQRLVAGPKDEPVKVAARHPGGEAFTADLTRSLPAARDAFPSLRPAKISELKPGIFYVDLDQISDDDFKGALDRLAGAQGIVFDLRGYPGNLSTIVIAHLTDKPVSSAHWNVPRVTRPDRQGWEWETSGWNVEPEVPRLKAKAAFITDGRAISYAETYLGIIENYHLAEIVGGPTAGTNGNVNPFTLPGGYNVTWTGMKVLKHDGSQHHGVGIHPTVPAARTLKGVAEGRDELLEKAVAVVGN